ncbi:MAG: molybdenum cofactor biosynthesis protein B [Candidatus Binataceae bacterium]|jgi:molybdenum cofactor biosynthesis protein B
MGVITASDTRTPETDDSGRIVKALLEAAGHEIAYYEIIRDDPALIAAAIKSHVADLDAVVINGGTGITARDSTFEAVQSVLDKELPGFGELFRVLSYQEIGSAAFLSRATAGVRAGKLVVSIPGSPDACRLALEKLLIPELGHIAHMLKL